MDHDDVLEFNDVLDIKEEDNDEYQAEEIIISINNDDDDQQGNGGSEIIKEEIFLDDDEEVVECVCRRCNATFKTMSSLKEHLNVCRVTPLNCKECSKTFFGLGNLRAHMKQHNSSNKPEFSYPVSKKRFKAMNIQTPVRTIECSFDCDLCDKKFKSLLVLREHRRCHFSETSNKWEKTKLSRKYKTRKLWTQGDEEYLVELWRQKFHEFDHRKNGEIYMEISSQFDSRPRKFTPQEVKVKINNLSNKYKREKRNIGTSGGLPSQWDLFYRIDAFMVGPNMNDLNLDTDDSISQDDQLFNGSSQSIASDTRNSASPSPSELYTSDTADASIKDSPSIAEKVVPSTSRAAKRHRSDDANEIEKLIELIKTTDTTIKFELNEIKNSDVKFLKIEKERNEIFKKHVANMGRLSEEIIKLLQK